MGRMNHTTKYVESWKQNKIPFFNSLENNFGDKEHVIVQELPSGKLIEIIWDGNQFSYSADGKHAGNIDSQISVYLHKYVYNKLEMIVKILVGQNAHFYGFIGKKGFSGVDIFVNDNFLDFTLVKTLYEEVKLKVPAVTFNGTLNKFKYYKEDRFLLRSYYEHPDKRAIGYRRIKQENLTK